MLFWFLQGQNSGPMMHGMSQQGPNNKGKETHTLFRPLAQSSLLFLVRKQNTINMEPWSLYIYLRDTSYYLHVDVYMWIVTGIMQHLDEDIRKDKMYFINPRTGKL